MIAFRSIYLPTLALAALGTLGAPGAAQCDKIWSTTWSNLTAFSSASTPSSANEAADDIDVVGLISRVHAHGQSSALQTPTLDTVWVRFYAWTPAGPGALQAEYAFAPGDPGLSVAPIPGELDLVLPAPFAATGQHFVSVQLVFASSVGANWTVWSANKNAQVGAPVYTRTDMGAWVADANGVDLHVDLYDDDGSAPPLDGCGQWFPVSSPGYASDHNGLRDVAVVAADDVWAVGESRVDGDTIPLLMHWDGGDWTIFPVPEPVGATPNSWTELSSVAAVASDDVWAVGSKRTTHPVDGFVGTQYYALHWDGTSWTEVPAPVTPAGCTGARLFGVDVIPSGEVLIGGSRCALSAPGGSSLATVLHWNGASLVEEVLPSIGPGGQSVESLAGTGPDDIWAVGGGETSDWWAESVIYHFDGSAWTHVPGPKVGLSQRLYDVEAIAPDDVWVVGESVEPGSVSPLFQHWDGSAWSTVPSPGGGADLQALASDDIFSVGAGIVHWDGNAWTTVDALACTAEFGLNGVDAVGPCDLWTVGARVTGGIQTLTAHLVPAWEDLGGELPLVGASAAPQLRVGGSLGAGTSVRLELHGSTPGARGVHILGTSRVDLPFFAFFGGMLIPAPDLLVPFIVDPYGRHVLDATMPFDAPDDLELFAQSWILDAAPASSVSSSNARLGATD